ncbi:MAG: cold shock domain-containing protein [Lentimicrobiaceae bacterium]|jgi:cold shock CspA family protein|nr:cold shock domain-containing protein [Lentimicrobiaceae bacterium]
MAKSQETFNKKEKEKKRLKKKRDKEQKKEERKANSDKGKSIEEMFAYVDHYGNISSTPPDPNKKRIIKAEDIQIGVSRQEATEPEDPTRNGTITFFNESKGYGFIKDDENKQSIFVHANGLINQVKENDKVTFEVEMGKKGLNAVRVKIRDKE